MSDNLYKPINSPIFIEPLDQTACTECVTNYHWTLLVSFDIAFNLFLGRAWLKWQQ